VVELSPEHLCLVVLGPALDVLPYELVYCQILVLELFPDLIGALLHGHALLLNDCS
jgi:hypothetical protein